MPADSEPCMCGSATLVTLVSRTCMTVTIITESVMAHLRAGDICASVRSSGASTFLPENLPKQAPCQSLDTPAALDYFLRAMRPRNAHLNRGGSARRVPARALPFSTASCPAGASTVGAGGRSRLHPAPHHDRAWRAWVVERRIGEETSGRYRLEGDVLAALDLRRFLSDRHPLASLWRFVQPWLYGDVGADKSWVPQHYDYGNDFYFAFLDRKFRLYSQAVFASDDETLEQAAQNKLDYVMDVCRLGPGSRVLDGERPGGRSPGYAGPRGVDVTMRRSRTSSTRLSPEWCATQTSPVRVRAVYESVFAYEPRGAVRRSGALLESWAPARLQACSGGLTCCSSRAASSMDFAAGRKKFDVSAFTYRYVFPGDHTPVVLPELFAAVNRTGLEPVALHNDRHSYYLDALGLGAQPRRGAAGALRAVRRAGVPSLPDYCGRERTCTGTAGSSLPGGVPEGAVAVPSAGLGVRAPGKRVYSPSARLLGHTVR